MRKLSQKLWELTLTDPEAWQELNINDRWIYDKLLLSCKLGYKCGPAGMPVPEKGSYIVRPITNMMGLSQHARHEFLHDSTEKLHPGEFWCEIFEGDHYSIDYHWGEPVLFVKGEQNKTDLEKWDLWKKVDEFFCELPMWLHNIALRYEWFNVEIIGHKIIEVHARQNPDFQDHDCDWIEPVYESPQKIPYGLKYIKTPEDWPRRGYFIKDPEK